MKLVAGALSLFLLAAPMQAQTNQIPPIIDRRNAEIANEIACECEKSGLEEAILVPDTGEMIDLTQNPASGTVGMDEFRLDNAVEKYDTLIHYHCHPQFTKKETNEYLDTLHSEGELDETQYASNIARMDEVNELLNFAAQVHSFNDVGTMIQVAHFFYQKHPNGKISFRCISLTEPGVLVTQYDLKPSLVETLHKIIEMQDKDPGWQNVTLDPSVSKYEFSVKMLGEYEGIFNAAFQYQETQKQYLRQHWDSPGLLDFNDLILSPARLEEYIDFLNKNTNVTITPLQMPYK